MTEEKLINLFRRAGKGAGFRGSFQIKSLISILLSHLRELDTRLSFLGSYALRKIRRRINGRGIRA